MPGVHVTESVSKDGLRRAEVAGPEYVSCDVMPAPDLKGYLREVRRKGADAPRRHWYPSYEEALAAAVNYAGAEPH